jgi:signal transduction histidine kinase/ActR/RegA family two-component response regulator
VTQAGEDDLLKAVALRNASTILKVRQRAEQDLVQARDALETRTSELALSLSMVKATLDSVTDAILVTDAGVRVTGMNEKFAGMWQLPESARHSCEHAELLEQMAGFFQNPAAFLARVDEIQHSAPETTFDLLTPIDGRVIERQSRPQVVEGRVVGRVWSFRDITERKLAERDREALLGELEAANSQMASLLRHAPAFMCVMRGPEHIYELVNDRYAQLVGGRDLVGKPVREALPEVAGQGFIELLDQVYRSGESYVGTGVTLKLQRQSLGPMDDLYVDFVYMALRDPGGAVSGVFVHGVDVTDHKRAENELRRLAADLAEADRRKTEFLATLAHELRNPLAPISNGLQIMRRAPDNPAAINKAREMMERQLTHMVHLVDDLLDIARISRGTVELKKTQVELKSVIASAVETSLPLVEAAGHKLSMSVCDEPLLLDADATRLAQVVSNLLNNAARYTQRGGRIGLTARRDGAMVVIEVTDTGVGIARESLEAAFEMFTQVGRSRERAQGGLGIGLSLVRRLVELHGGTVSAASAGPGQGSTFTVRLPLAGAQVPAQAAGVAASDTAQGDSRRFRVLVVDDNTDAAETLAAFLEIGGHSTRVASDGPHALDAAASFQPEVVFLDIGMPGMNGYEVARALRLLPGLRHAVIVALTGWGTEADRSRSREAGFDLHLTKPADMATVEHLLARLAQPG